MTPVPKKLTKRQVLIWRRAMIRGASPIVALIAARSNGAVQHLNGDDRYSFDRDLYGPPSGVTLPAPAIPATGRVYIGAAVDTSGGLSGEAGIEQREADTGRTYDLDLHYYGWREAFNFAAGSRAAQDIAHGRIPQISWGYGDLVLDDILDGSSDPWIAAQADAARAFGSPFFLRFGIEMNSMAGAGYELRPADFITAWRRVHGIFRARGATNAAFVWCPNIDSKGGTTWDDYWPGDAYVDWTGVDGYNTDAYGDSDRSFATIFQPFLTYAAAKGKPIMIGECASDDSFGSKATWIASMGQWVQDNADTYDLRAVCWFDINTSTSGLDYTVDSTPAAYDAWKNAVARTIFGGPGYDPAPTGTAVVSDSFNRADGPVGNADTGQPWVVVSGGVVVSGNRLGVTGTGTKVAYVDAGVADGTMQLTSYGVNGVTSDGMMLRYIDGTHLAFFRNSTGQFFVADGAGPTAVQTFTAGSPGDVVQIILAGDQARVERNGVSLGTVTLPASLIAATKYGIRSFGNATDAYDDLQIVAADLAFSGLLAAGDTYQTDPFEADHVDAVVASDVDGLVVSLYETEDGVTLTQLDQTTMASGSATVTGGLTQTYAVIKVENPAASTADISVSRIVS